MGFVNSCIEDSMSIWEQCLRTDFLMQMQDGTLPEENFKGYIVDDSLYLREYAKVFAWGMIKARDMDAVRTYYSLLSFVNEGEGATRLQYLKKYGLQDSEIQYLPQREENRVYTETMVSAAREGAGAPECMMACLPCMLSYCWIFRIMVKENPQVLNTVYGPMIRDYASQSYEDCCRSWSAYADRICEDLPAERKKACMKIFRQCSLCELGFWHMSEKPREDI